MSKLRISFKRSKLGQRKYSFSTLLNAAWHGKLENIDCAYTVDNSFIDIHEERKLNSRKFDEQMKRNRMKVKIREK